MLVKRLESKVIMQEEELTIKNVYPKSTIAHQVQRASSAIRDLKIWFKKK